MQRIATRRTSLALSSLAILLLAVSTTLETPASGQPNDPIRDEVRTTPYYFEVYDVASDDFLFIRSEPSPDSAIIGALMPNDPVVQIISRSPNGSWGKVGFGDTINGWIGWVSMRYLRPAPIRVYSGTNVPLGLACVGEEPFWSVRFDYGHVDRYWYGDYENSLPIRSVELLPGANGEAYHVVAADELEMIELTISPDGRGRSAMGGGQSLWSIRSSNLPGAVYCGWGWDPVTQEQCIRARGLDAACDRWPSLAELAARQ